MCLGWGQRAVVLLSIPSQGASGWALEMELLSWLFVLWGTVMESFA